MILNEDCFMKMSKVNVIGTHLSPLCYLPSGKLVCYKFGELRILSGDKVVERYAVFKNKKETILGRFNPIYRLLRLGVRSAIAIDEDRIVISVANMLFEYDFREKQLSKGYCLGERIRPLIFTEVHGIEGFRDGIVFGGYRVNPEKKEVHIYRRMARDNWEIVSTFPHGSITHVHNIVPDPYRKCLWAFTGDFGDESAIWRITDDFRQKERLFYGEQKYRGCVAFALPEGVLYATDSPFEQDYIYFMDESMTFQPIAPINGSCIYGCRWKNQFVFSTTVEGDGRGSSSFLRVLFSKKRGAGIHDDNAYLYVGDLHQGFNVQYYERKDWLSFLFQFGVFKFPVGENNSDFLYFQPVATRKNDLKLLRLRNTQ